jgi:hypothetical protein
MMRPWQTQKPPDSSRLTRGEGNRRREVLIRTLEECSPDADHMSPAEFADGVVRPVIPPRVKAVLDELRECSRVIMRGSRRHRHQCRHSLCPACNRYGSPKAIYRGEAQRGWKLIAHTHSDPAEFRYLTINIIELDSDSPEFPAYAERARSRLKRILAEHPGAIFLGQFEFNATPRDQIKLGLHGWLIGPAEQAEQIKLACCDYFGFGHPVNMKPIHPGIVRDHFQYALGYACKLPKLVFRASRGYRVDLSALVGLIDRFEGIRSRTGRQGLRLEIGIRNRTHQYISLGTPELATQGDNSSPALSDPNSPQIIFDPLGDSHSTFEGSNPTSPVSLDSHYDSKRGSVITPGIPSPTLVPLRYPMTVDPHLDITIQMILGLSRLKCSDFETQFLSGCRGRLCTRDLSEKQFSTLGQIGAVKLCFPLDQPQSVFDPRMEPSERSQQFDCLLGYWTRELNPPGSDCDSELTEIPCSTSVRDRSTKGVLEVIRSPPSCIAGATSTQATQVGQSHRRSYYG